MAHVYNNFPGALDKNGRPLGVCNCGRWADSTDEVNICPNHKVNILLLSTFIIN